jgi:hypothetical protein
MGALFGGVGHSMGVLMGREWRSGLDYLQDGAGAPLDGGDSQEDTY